MEQKETELMSFLEENAARLRMNVPAMAAVRETIAFLAEQAPQWEEQTSPEEFAKILLERYPELKFEWTGLEATSSETVDDEPATEKQIAYLKVLGAPVPDYLGIREAADLIEKWKVGASDAQKRRLDFYQLTYDRDITREQAATLIDDYKARHPESEAAYQEWKMRNQVA
jgi:hypothetical protein